MTKAANAAAERMDEGVRLVTDLPRVKRLVGRASGVTSHVRGRIPRSVADAAMKGGSIVDRAAQGGVRAVSRYSTAALSPQRVVDAHAGAGHAVTTLHQLRSLDLQQVDRVMPRALDLRYATAGALSGAGAGAGITVLGLSGPGIAAIGSLMLFDAAAVVGLASAVVGHTALYYGYDTTRPEEKAFVLSVVDFGTSLTAAGKNAAFRDIVKLTHALRVQKTWEKINESLVSRVISRFASELGKELTKRQLTKAVPYVGAAIGGSTNFLTIEMIADAAQLAYRRRWLLDKYPNLPVQQPEAMLAVFESDERQGDNLGVVQMLEDEGVSIPDGSGASRD